MVTFYLGVLVAIGFERMMELRQSARNSARALARGGVEVGQGHLGFMKLLHTAFLFGCGAEVLLLGRPWVPGLGWTMLGATVLAQALRYWAIATLGDRWNVRVIVEPSREAVARGPYRWMRHPNYLAVIVEGIAIPCMHSAWIVAVAFSVINLVLLLILQLL